MIITEDAAGHTVVDGRRILRPCLRCEIQEATWRIGSKGNTRNKRRAAKYSSTDGHYCLYCCNERIKEMNGSRI